MNSLIDSRRWRVVLTAGLFSLGVQGCGHDFVPDDDAFGNELSLHSSKQRLFLGDTLFVSMTNVGSDDLYLIPDCAVIEQRTGRTWEVPPSLGSVFACNGDPAAIVRLANGQSRNLSIAIWDVEEGGFPPIGEFRMVLSYRKTAGYSSDNVRAASNTFTVE